MKIHNYAVKPFGQELNLLEAETQSALSWNKDRADYWILRSLAAQWVLPDNRRDEYEPDPELNIPGYAVEIISSEHKVQIRHRRGPLKGVHVTYILPDKPVADFYGKMATYQFFAFTLELKIHLLHFSANLRAAVRVCPRSGQSYEDMVFRAIWVRITDDPGLVQWQPEMEKKYLLPEPKLIWGNIDFRDGGTHLPHFHIVNWDAIEREYGEVNRSKRE